MKRFLPILLIPLFIYSCKIGCKTKSEYNTPKKEHVFKSRIHMTYRQPYCGGARPSPEMEKGTIVDFRNKEFVIKVGNSNHDSIPVLKRVMTDEHGVFQLNLPKGDYVIVFPHKAQSYESFKKEELKNFEGKQLQLTNEDCLKEYWERADGKFSVSDESDYDVEIRRTCYADFNYCMQYTGPLPP